jgi:hypothetical protein
LSRRGVDIDSIEQKVGSVRRLRLHLGMNERTIFFAVFLSLCGAFGSARAQAPATVVVELTNSRRWEGFIDARSTPRQLVLRFERGSTVLWRPIPWSTIRTAVVNSKAITGDELARSYQPLISEAKPRTSRTTPPAESSPSDHPSRAVSSEDTVAPEEKPPLPPAKVISISCDALLANWDADVEADGLVIHLQPLDAWQEIVAASGTLEVVLHTLQARAFHHASNSRGRSVEPIIRWSQAVNLKDYRARGAMIQLPFQAAHPEFDDSLGAYGLVHIKFSVPGSGVFEQSIDGVRIRPWSPLRDYLQMDTGYRFLPHERTGRGKASWFTDDQ